LIDDYSRYALAAVASTTPSTDWVTLITQEVIRRCGQPAELVSDNGREFVSVWEDTLTQFGQLLKDHHIEHLKCAPYYPQGNGKGEAFHKTLKRELLSKRTFDTLDELLVALDEFLTYYNNYRHHSAIDWQTPALRYTGRSIAIHGLAGIPDIEAMAADPRWGESYCDPPIEIAPSTAQNARAIVPWIASSIAT
jgi:transposase InsO family protein